MAPRIVTKLTIVRAQVGNHTRVLCLNLPYTNGKPQVSQQMIRDYLGYKTNIPISFPQGI